MNRKRNIIIGSAIITLIAALFYFTTKKDYGLIYIAKVPPVELALEGLNERLAERSLNLSYEEGNALGQISNISPIVNNFKNKDYNVIMALTTPCAQVAKNQIKDKPIIFVGVSDPVGAGLVETLDHGFENVTGTMSLDPVFENLKLAAKLFPSIKKVGILYSASESNSSSILKLLNDSIDNSDIGIEIIEQPIKETSEIYRASTSLVKKVDAIFLINDNTVFSSVQTVLDVADENELPVFASDIESVKLGALFTHGLDYKDEGIAAADILYQIWVEGKSPNEIPVFVNDKYYLYINKKIINFGVDISQFESPIIIE